MEHANGTTKEAVVLELGSMIPSPFLVVGRVAITYACSGRLEMFIREHNTFLVTFVIAAEVGDHHVDDWCGLLGLEFARMSANNQN
eukprot:1647353-Ditylum_brightwellii.AAC.1